MRTPTDDLSREQDTRTLTAILSGGLLSALGVALFAFTVPLVSMDERMSGAWLGSAFAGYFLAKLLVSPLSGMAADRYGPRRILALAMSAGCLVPLFYFLWPSLETLYAIQIAMGLISGLIRPVGLASLGTSGDETTLAHRFAIHSALFSGAAFIGPVLGSLLYFNRSMTPVLLMLAACMGLAGVATLLLLPKTATTRRPRPAHPAHDDRTKVGAIPLFLAIGGRTLGLGLLFAFYPIVLTTALGRDGLTVGLAYAMPGLATFAGLLLSGRFATGQPTPRRVVGGIACSAASLFALGHCSALWQFITFGTLMGLGAALSIPSSMTMASSLTHRQGAVFGTAHFASGVGFLFGPLLGGLAVHHFHSVLPGIQAAAVIGALACLPLAAIILRDDFHWGVWMSRTFTGLAAAVLIGLLAFTLPSRSTGTAPGENLHRFTDVAMGTIVTLTLEARDRQTAERAAHKTMAAMRTLQQDFDHRSPNGSIGRINRAAGQSWITPTPRTFDLLARALAFSEQSNGVFDPTIGALTTSPLYFALDETLAKAKADLVDADLVQLDHASKRVRLAKAGMALDLGGIAKGTIVDTAVGLLRKQHIVAGIVEAGGDFYCFGDRDWKVGIRHPRNDEVYRTITVREQGVCGSGDYQQFIATEQDGQSAIRHHIIDPATMGSAAECIGVTVIADSAESADALATTLFIMGPQKGTAFLNAHAPNSSATWFLPNDTVTATENFPN